MWSDDVSDEVPGGGIVNVGSWKHLQPQHADLTDLNNCLRVGIQCSS